MGELFEKTCERRASIKNLGYAYEEIWEDELDAAKTLLTVCVSRPAPATESANTSRRELDAANSLLALCNNYHV